MSSTKKTTEMVVDVRYTERGNVVEFDDGTRVLVPHSSRANAIGATREQRAVNCLEKRAAGVKMHGYRVYEPKKPVAVIHGGICPCKDGD